MHNVNNADFSGIHMLENVVRTYRDRGGDVFLVRVSFRVMQRIMDTQFDQYIGSDHFLDEDDAISHLFHHVVDPAICIYECPIRVFKECQNLPKRLDLIGISLDRDLSEKEFPTVKSADLWTLLNEGKHEQLPEVIDVREPREFNRGHIYGALSIPLPLIASLDPALPKRCAHCSRLSQRPAQQTGCLNYAKDWLLQCFYSGRGHASLGIGRIT